jgi:hypothetical protein
MKQNVLINNKPLLNFDETQKQLNVRINYSDRNFYQASQKYLSKAIDETEEFKKYLNIVNS